MTKNIRKIDLMHHLFGKAAGMHICKECSNFAVGRYHSKFLKKCKVYGLTHSEASDWANKYEACGMFNKEYDGVPIIQYVKHNRLKQEEQIEGQLSFIEENYNG